ncbi:MAG: hypothetical protein LBP19_06020 [Treponema sp.]|jgi:prefoldin subunit 5|nr:hypothetical protein [Treponema sp.]
MKYEYAEERSKKKKETIDATLKEVEDEYNRCYRIIRKTYDYLERIGLQDFNKFSKYKWSFDRDRRGFSYVCVRNGGSLLKKSLVKRSGSLEEPELLRWLDTKNLVCEALDEAYEYIDEKIGTLKLKMTEMKGRIQKYEDWGNVFDETMEAVKVGKIEPEKR